MVERKVSKMHYLRVGVFTILIFFLGVALAIIFDNERLNWLLQVNREQELKYQSMQLQYLFISTQENTEGACQVLEASLEQSIAELGKTLDTLETYKKDSSINKIEYELINQRYVLDNLQYWLFVSRMKSLCKKDLVTVLYFYSSDNCPSCPDQGVILTYFKKIFQDRLLIFPINLDLQKLEPMISLLQKRYNVTSMPSIIVEDKKYFGVISKEELKNIICSSFKSAQKECA